MKLFLALTTYAENRLNLCRQGVTKDNTQPLSQIIIYIKIIKLQCWHSNCFVSGKHRIYVMNFKQEMYK